MKETEQKQCTHQLHNLLFYHHWNFTTSTPHLQEPMSHVGMVEFTIVICSAVFTDENSVAPCFCSSCAQKRIRSARTCPLGIYRADVWSEKLPHLKKLQRFEKILSLFVDGPNCCRPSDPQQNSNCVLCVPSHISQLCAFARLTRRTNCSQVSTDLSRKASGQATSSPPLSSCTPLHAPSWPCARSLLPGRTMRRTLGQYHLFSWQFVVALVHTGHKTCL